MAKAKKLPSGNWRVNLYVGLGGDGKRKYKSFTAATKKEAEYAAAEYNVTRKGSPDNMTLGQAFDKYVESKEHIFSPATVRNYNSTRRASLVNLMNLPLRKIDNEKIQIELNHEAQTLSPQTVRTHKKELTAVLNAYMPDFRIRVTLPPLTQPTYHTPTDAEVNAIIEHFKANGNDDMVNAVMLAAYGSLRAGEISALTGADLRGNILTVNKSRVKKVEKGYCTKSTKTFSSNREIELPDFLVKRLNSEAETLVKFTPNTLSQQFRVAVKELGFSRIRFHDLRHYQATILHAMGVPDKYIMERGGWSSISVLKTIYQQTTEDKKAEITSKINAYFEIMQHEKQHI